MKRKSVAAVAAVVVLLANPVKLRAQSVDEPVDLGDVTIVNEKRERLSEGNGGTVFRLQLPPGASCPGDSQNDQWRVQTFIVPSDIDPARLSYNSIGPDGDGRYALYGLDTNPITAVLTAPNANPGAPGLIIGLRAASFEIFPPGTLPDGTYRVGVACTYFGETASFWDTLVEVNRDPEDQPAEIRWQPVSGVSDAVSGIATDQNSNTGSVTVVAAAVLAVVAVGTYFTRRSRRSSVHPKEMS